MKAPLALPLGRQVREAWILRGQREQIFATMKILESYFLKGNVSEPQET